MGLPFLHPFHATASGDHLLLWLAVGAGIGVAVVLGIRIYRDLVTPEDGPDGRDDR